MQWQYRLRKPHDFARLRQEGRAYRHPYLTLSLAPNELSHNRYGFVTSKHLGNAVTRNRVRRLLREAIYHFRPVLKQGYDVVVIARPAIVGQPLPAVKTTLGEILTRAKMITVTSNGNFEGNAQ